jgi:hypothetical protein
MKEQRYAKIKTNQITRATRGCIRDEKRAD